MKKLLTFITIILLLVSLTSCDLIIKAIQEKTSGKTEQTQKDNTKKDNTKKDTTKDNSTDKDTTTNTGTDTTDNTDKDNTDTEKDPSDNNTNTDNESDTKKDNSLDLKMIITDQYGLVERNGYQIFPNNIIKLSFPLDTNAKIYYTLDGSEPTKNKNNLYEDYWGITYENDFEYTNGSLYRVLKAKAFSKNGESNTFERKIYKVTKEAKTNLELKEYIKRAFEKDSSKVSNKILARVREDENFFDKKFEKLDLNYIGLSKDLKDISFAFFPGNDIDAKLFDADISYWDVSYVENMNSLFKNSVAFNSDLSKWNTKNVKDMSSMFENAYSFNKNISSWDTSSVTTMSRIFQGAYSFNQNLSNWDVKNVTSFDSMFSEALSFNSNLDNWMVIKATDFSNMFGNAISFNKPLNSWIFSNNRKVMQSMFENATSFNQDLNNWNLEGVMMVSAMFKNSFENHNEYNEAFFEKLNLNKDYNISKFNGDITTWSLINVFNADEMLTNANSFYQDIHNWKVSQMILESPNIRTILTGTKLVDKNNNALKLEWIPTDLTIKILSFGRPNNI